MPKVNLPRFESGFGTTVKLNEAMAQIEVALDNTISRDGSSPNQMEADLDLNNQTLLNSGVSDDPNRVVTFQEMEEFISEHSSGLVVQQGELQIATNLQTVFDLQNLQYSPGSFNLAVYVNGIRKFAPQDYSETSPTRVTFLAGITLGAQVEFVLNEFLGTISLPTHTHPFSQITNLPVYVTRWPEWTEVTSKPSTFPPSAHTHPASDITSGRLNDAQRGVWVQASQPVANTVGELWFW